MKLRLSLLTVLLVCGLSFHLQGQDKHSVLISICRIGSGAGQPIRIQSLAVRITTNKARGSGTDNVVYFDIGPLGWKLNLPKHNDFEKGQTATYPLLPLPPIKGQQASPFQLTTEDILWLRLHKKGIAGVTGLGDGFDGAWHPEKITVIVNGSEYCSTGIDQPLNSSCWFWRRMGGVDPYADAKSWARTLRLQKNDRLNWVARATGFISTPLAKRRGISGWLRCPEDKECSSCRIAARECRPTFAPPEW